MKVKPFPISPNLKVLIDVINDHGGRPLVVGGAVRDFLLGLSFKDIDIEVYGLDFDTLEKELKKHFYVEEIGKTFGILLVVVEVGGIKQTFDVALPRTENKLGIGHKAFKINTDPFLSFEKASLRRDFTINAMGYDVIKQELIDPHGGALDLKKKVLRHVSNAFAEDPLRVLRAAQFIARFDLTLDESTGELCKKLKDELFSLSKERIYGEIKKLLLSPKPSKGFLMLKETENLAMFPELLVLINCPQEYEWHPEGDVWIHTLMVIDEARELLRNLNLSEEEELIITLGALCHDLGKPLTTVNIDGRIKSPGHEEAGVEPTRSLLTSFGFSENIIDEVIPLVKDHLKPYQLYKKKEEVTDSAIRRLAHRVNISRLLLVSKADFCGRTTPDALLKDDPSYNWLKERAEALNVKHSAPTPILMGRHLIDLGMKPGKEMGALLKKAYEAQLDGEFFDLDGAIAYVKSIHNNF